MKKHFISLTVFALISMTGMAQVTSNIQMRTSINDDGSVPDNSAILHLQSTDKGFLVPRMTEAEMNAILNPADGLIVYVLDLRDFYYAFLGSWNKLKEDDDADSGNELITGGVLNGNNLEITEAGIKHTIPLDGLAAKSLTDDDNDTKIQVEESVDEDIIRFDIGGTEELKLSKNAHGDLMIETPSDVLIGFEAGMSNSNAGNTMVGYRAGRLNVGGSSNTFIGNSTGSANTNGIRNTFVGAGAGVNSMEDRNSFIGYYAGHDNTTGQHNTFFGNEAGEHNDTGDFNVFLGSEAGQNNETGGNNVFLGMYSGKGNKDGSSNTFIGRNSGWSNFSGTHNTYIGNHAGAPTEGIQNTFVGAFTGQFSTSGSHNVFIGYNAGAFETDDNQLYIDNSNTAAPLIYGDFALDYVQINGKLHVGTEILEDGGADKLKVHADIIPSNVAFDLGNNVADEHWDDVVADDFINFSDARQKRNVKTLADGLEVITQLRPVTYQYIHEPEFAGDSYGLIAQEVLPILPEVVKTHEIDMDENGNFQQTPVDVFGINYVELIPLLIKGMQEQQAMILELKNELEHLKH